MPLKPGTRLGAYEIVDVLGAGSMGEVYRASDPRLGRNVAIKVMSGELSKDTEWLRRFQQEARATAALSHQNVLAVYDVGIAEGISFVVTELLQGETLRERLLRGRIETKQALQIALEVVSGLGAVHAQGIIHRDLKPENIYLTIEGHAKILDFGLAKVTKMHSGEPSDNDCTLTTQPGMMLGTMSYMAPEQARGYASDLRSDLFSLGAILYEMLCGQRPFQGNTPVDVISAVLKEEPASLSSHGVLVAPALVRILNRCLEKQPSNRFQSAADLAFALKSISDSHTGLAVAQEPAHRERSIAVMPLTNMNSDSEQDYFSDGLAEELINALAGLGGLRVASRTSAFRFRGRELDIREIGRQLNVETILEGSVRRAGKRLRVTAQLIDTSNGYYLWSQRYDRELEDVFAIQDEITESIVKMLKPTLLGDHKPLSERHTENLEAFELYLKGRYLWQQRTQKGLRAGIECFQDAIELDCNYALAHCGIADSFSILRVYGYVSVAEGKTRAEIAARRALELNAGLAEAHFSMALFTFSFTEDWPSAEESLRRAVQIAPQNSLFQVFFGGFLATRHRFQEAKACATKSTELDPLSPYAHCIFGLTMYMVGSYETALKLAQRSLELQSDYALGLWVAGLASSKLGLHTRAVEALERLVLISNRANLFVGTLGMAYALAGRESDALIMLDELDRRSDQEYVSSHSRLLVEIGIGNRDRIYNAFRACIDDQVPGFPLEYTIGPYINELESEPRFAEMFRSFRLVQPRTLTTS